MAGTHSSTPVVAIATVLAGGFVLVIAVDRGLDVLTACAVLGAVVLLLAHRSARRPAGGTSST